MEIIIDQGSKAWHLLRANKIGASDAACILGTGFKNAEKLWKEKLGLEQVYVNDAMRRGSALEPKARRAFEEEMGKKFRPAVFVSDELQWMMASLDGISEDGKTIVEIKCGNEKLHQQAEQGIVPPYYIAQMQHQMKVVGVDVCHYWSWNGEKGALVIIPRDNEFIERYIPKAKEFWESLQTFTKPDSGYVEIQNEEWKELAERYRGIQKILDELEVEEKDIRKKLEVISNGMPAKGYGLTFMRASRKGNIDYGKIPELRNVDLEQYRKSGSEYWRLLTSNVNHCVNA